MLSNFCKPLIYKPTRFNNTTSASLIDNISINSLDHTTLSGNLIDKISDHLPNFVFFQSELNKSKSSEDHSLFRDYKKFNKGEFIEEANYLFENFSNDQQPKDINMKYMEFQNEFLNIL